MGALGAAILESRLLAAAIFGHFSTEGKNGDAKWKSYKHSVLKS